MALFIAVTGGTIGISLVVFIDHTNPFDVFPLNGYTLTLVIASIPVLLAYAELVSILSPVRLSSDGIYGHSFWGKKRFVRWQEVRAVKPIRILNLRFLRIYSTGNGKVTWLPLFQARKAEFIQEIQRLAPGDNPVLNHFG